MTGTGGKSDKDDEGNPFKGLPNIPEALKQLFATAGAEIQEISNKEECLDISIPDDPGEYFPAVGAGPGRKLVSTVRRWITDESAATTLHNVMTNSMLHTLFEAMPYTRSILYHGYKHARIIPSPQDNQLALDELGNGCRVTDLRLTPFDSYCDSPAKRSEVASLCFSMIRWEVVEKPEDPVLGPFKLRHLNGRTCSEPVPFYTALCMCTEELTATGNKGVKYVSKVLAVGPLSVQEAYKLDAEWTRMDTTDAGWGIEVCGGQRGNFLFFSTPLRVGPILKKD